MGFKHMVVHTSNAIDISLQSNKLDIIINTYDCYENVTIHCTIFSLTLKFHLLILLILKWDL